MKLHLDMSFEEIFTKLDRHELVIVHLKNSMEAKLYDPYELQLYEVPEGYLDYDREHFFKKI